MSNIWNTILTLPKPIRRVCYVQIFAFMGWFPFLFYSYVTSQSVNLSCSYRLPEQHILVK